MPDKSPPTPMCSPPPLHALQRHRRRCEQIARDHANNKYQAHSLPSPASQRLSARAMADGRSLAETPTWSVATVTTAMVAVCFLVERSIHRLGKWLKKTKRKAMLAAVEKIREELMLLGLISLMLSQTARWISEICVPSALFSSRFYICSEDDFSINDVFVGSGDLGPLNHTTLVSGLPSMPAHHCSQDHEPFVSFEGLEQLHRFLFILGITHVLYSFVTVVLSMIKIFSWRKWEEQAFQLATENLQEKKMKTVKRQSTFVFHHASHPWSKSKILIWMLCFIRQFKGSITRSDYMALRLGFITNHRLPLSYNFHKYMVRSMEDEYHGSVGISWPLWIYAILCIFVNIHGLNIYFWLSFVPAILVMLVGTKLQHVVAQLALEIVGSTGPSNAFEMATFIWSLWELNEQSCFMKNHVMVVIRLISGLVVQVWCSFSTLPLNVIITQMGSKFKKSLISESVRESLHSWCKRVKERSKCDSRFGTTASICSLEEFTINEMDETNTLGSGTLSPRSPCRASLDDLDAAPMDEQAMFNISRL